MDRPHWVLIGVLGGAIAAAAGVVPLGLGQLWLALGSRRTGRGARP